MVAKKMWKKEEVKESMKVGFSKEDALSRPKWIDGIN